jgi:hypothetical protein
MRLVLLTLPLALVVGTLAGGRIGRLPSLPFRWVALVAVGVALQFVPVSGSAGAILLIASFVLLCAFAVRNLALPGLPLILLGLALNLTVIALNSGMPVSKGALIRSGQASTLATLRNDGGSKHHLATHHDELLPLGDVLALPPPVRQAISVGDIATHAGIVWLIVWGMLRTPAPTNAGSNSGYGEARPDPASKPRLIGAAREDI